MRDAPRAPHADALHRFIRLPRASAVSPLSTRRPSARAKKNVHFRLDASISQATQRQTASHTEHIPCTPQPPVRTQRRIKPTSA